MAPVPKMTCRGAVFMTGVRLTVRAAVGRSAGAWCSNDAGQGGEGDGAGGAEDRELLVDVDPADAW